LTSNDAFALELSAALLKAQRNDFTTLKEMLPKTTDAESVVALLMGTSPEKGVSPAGYIPGDPKILLGAEKEVKNSKGFDITMNAETAGQI